jgi:hypothetical protein
LARREPLNRLLKVDTTVVHTDLGVRNLG